MRKVVEVGKEEVKLCGHMTVLSVQKFLRRLQGIFRIAGECRDIKVFLYISNAVGKYTFKTLFIVAS